MKVASFAILLLTILYVCECYPQKDGNGSVNANEPVINHNDEYSLNQYEVTMKSLEKPQAQYNNDIPVSAIMDGDYLVVFHGNDEVSSINGLYCNCPNCVMSMYTRDNIQTRIKCEYDGAVYRYVVYYRDSNDSNSHFVGVPIEN